MSCAFLRRLVCTGGRAPIGIRSVLFYLSLLVDCCGFDIEWCVHSSLNSRPLVAHEVWFAHALSRLIALTLAVHLLTAACIVCSCSPLVDAGAAAMAGPQLPPPLSPPLRAERRRLCSDGAGWQRSAGL